MIIKQFRNSAAIFALFFISFVPLFAQNVVLSGKVYDTETKSLLSHATVRIIEKNISMFTSETGNFSIDNLKPGNYKLEVSFVGYKSESMQVNVADKKNEVAIGLKPTTINLGDVVVSSLRSDILLKDIPLPIEVIDRQVIERSTSNTVGDLLKGQSGVAMNRDGAWETDVVIRGISGQSIITMVDGNRIETATEHAARLDMFDMNSIERIEIIKGAASSIYGTGGLGGVINIITKPGFFYEGVHYDAKVTSSYQTVNEGISNGLLLNYGSKNWYLKLSGAVRNAVDTKTPDGMLNNSRFHDHSENLSFGLRVTDAQSLRLNLQNFRGEDIGIPGGAAFATSAIVRYRNVQRMLGSLDYTINDISSLLSNIDIKAYTQYIVRDVEMYATPTATTVVTPNARHLTIGANATAHFNLMKDNVLTAGIDSWWRNLDSKREKSTPATGTIIGEKPLPIAQFLSNGIFAQDEHSLFNGKLKLLVGARVDNILTTSDSVYLPDYKTVNGNPVTVARKLMWQAYDKSDYSWSANFGALYKVIENTSVTFNVARSFRVPSPEERYQYIDLGTTIKLGNPDLNPENGLFLDLGVQHQHGPFNFAANVFMNSVSDLVVDLPGDKIGTVSTLVKRNVGKANLYGYEIKADVTLPKGFAVYTSVSYVRGEDTEMKRNLPLIPPVSGIFGVRANVYDLVFVDANVIGADRQENLGGSDISTAGYLFYNLYLNSADLKFNSISAKVSVGVENITDVSYRNFLSSNRGLIKSEPGRNFIFKVSVGI